MTTEEVKDKGNTFPRLKVKFNEEVVAALMKEFNYANVMEVPKIEKIVLNVGIGKEYSQYPKVLEAVQKDLKIIAGQRPVVIKARKSIASFRLRQNMPNGVKVTIRGKRMFQFLDKLISINLPRIRDFRGLDTRSFDGRGNYALGIKEQLIFPEVNYDSIDKIRGMEIIITTTAKTDEEGKKLLEFLGMPFKK